MSHTSSPKKALDGIVGNLFEDFEEEVKRLKRFKEGKLNYLLIGIGNDKSLGYNFIEKMLTSDHVKSLVALSRKPKDDESFQNLLNNLYDVKHKFKPEQYDPANDDPTKLTDILKENKIDAVLITVGKVGKGDAPRDEEIAYCAPLMANYAFGLDRFNGISVVFTNPIEATQHEVICISGNNPYSVMGYTPDVKRLIDNLHNMISGESDAEIKIPDQLRREAYDNKELEKHLIELAKKCRHAERGDIKNCHAIGVHAESVTVPKEDAKDIDLRFLKMGGDGDKVQGMLKIFDNIRLFDESLIGKLTAVWNETYEITIDEMMSSEMEKQYPAGTNFSGSIYHANFLRDNYIPFLTSNGDREEQVSVWNNELGVPGSTTARIYNLKVWPLTYEEMGVSDEIKKVNKILIQHYTKKHIELIKNSLRYNPKKGIIAWTVPKKDANGNEVWEENNEIPENERTRTKLPESFLKEYKGERRDEWIPLITDEMQNAVKERAKKTLEERAAIEGEDVQYAFERLCGDIEEKIETALNDFNLSEKAKRDYRNNFRDEKKKNQKELDLSETRILQIVKVEKEEKPKEEPLDLGYLYVSGSKTDESGHSIQVVKKYRVSNIDELDKTEHVLDEEDLT
ncbi:hypothetical protein KY342_01140, partial [Candidatus Woesearchaeota archaeon]|nr:hypothetical protein [Candidatus Woesearchaeota archaeon]